MGGNALRLDLASHYSSWPCITVL